MPGMLPFKGVLYNLDIVKDMSRVIAPPYDVIDPADEPFYLDMHPNNAVRLTGCRLKKGAMPDRNRHKNAARTLKNWLQNGILSRESAPAFYVYETRFRLDLGIEKVRRGLFCLVELNNYGKGVVLPHEQTFSRTKEDQLSLMIECRAHLSPIFALIDDPDGEFLHLITSCTAEKAPLFAFQADDGTTHVLWKCDDQETIERIIEDHSSRKIFIADGHHRYETSLRYREIMREIEGKKDSPAPYDFTLMHLSSIRDPGVITLPVHRVMRRVPVLAEESFFKKTDAFFDVSILSAADLYQVARAVEEGEEVGKLAYCPASLKKCYLLKVRDWLKVEKLMRPDLPPLLRRTDVSLLHNFLLPQIFGIDRIRDEDEIKFTPSVTEIASCLSNGEWSAAFLIRSTRMEQLRKAAESGIKLPPKSTYFYPKVPSGLIFYLMY